MVEILIANAFSLSMLDPEEQVVSLPNGRRTPAPLGDETRARNWLRNWTEAGAYVRSVVGHADTARVFSNLLGREVSCNRETVKLQPNQILLVGQYTGPRLPEGATELPEGASIFWWAI